MRQRADGSHGSHCIRRARQGRIAAHSCAHSQHSSSRCARIPLTSGSARENERHEARISVWSERGNSLRVQQPEIPDRPTRAVRFSCPPTPTDRSAAAGSMRGDVTGLRRLLAVLALRFGHSVTLAAPITVVHHRALQPPGRSARCHCCCRCMLVLSAAQQQEIEGKGGWRCGCHADRSLTHWLSLLSLGSLQPAARRLQQQHPASSAGSSWPSARCPSSSCPIWMTTMAQ